MKKIFNLAVIFAALMTAVSFSSCADEDKAEEEANEQALAYVQVKQGDKIYFSNSSVGEDGKGGIIEITEAITSETDKIVTFKLATKKDAQKKEEFTIGQSGSNPSYVLWDGSAFKTGMQADAQANPAQVVFCLSSKPSEVDSKLSNSACVLTSATINAKVKASAAEKNIKLGQRTLMKELSDLKKSGVLKREGGRKEGIWIIMKSDNEQSK